MPRRSTAPKGEMGSQLLCGAATATGGTCSHPRRKGARDCGRHDRVRAALDRPNLVFVDTAGSDPLAGDEDVTDDPVVDAGRSERDQVEYRAALRASKAAKRAVRTRLGLRGRDIGGVHVGEPDALGIRTVTMGLSDTDGLSVATRVRERDSAVPVPIEPRMEPLTGGTIDAVRADGEAQSFPFSVDALYGATLDAARRWRGEAGEGDPAGGHRR